MIISLDIGLKKAIAYAGIAGDTLVFVGSTEKKGASGLDEIFAFIRDAHKYNYRYIETIVTERPYKKANPEVFRQFAQIIGRIEEFCNEQDIELQQIMPAHWKRSYLAKTKFPAKSKEANALLNSIAESIIRRNNFTPDERDAVLLGMYYARRKK
ncbi:MAG: hypothetical protein GXO75_08345 [Calditrichaeota bacterium]|nr:hypothetical protein [Calditrichota bacterium]